VPWHEQALRKDFCLEAVHISYPYVRMARVIVSHTLWVTHCESHVKNDFSLEALQLSYPYPHETLLGIQWASNPSTENQRKSTPAHSNGCKSETHVSLELMVQIKQKGVHGIETLLPRSFLGGCDSLWHVGMTPCDPFPRFLVTLSRVSWWLVAAHCHVWHDSLFDKARFYVSFDCVTRLMCMCDKTHVYVW